MSERVERWCVCGHMQYEHPNNDGRCRGHAGKEACTCLGYREAKSSKQAHK